MDKKTNPIVSIIIPCKNYDQYVEETIYNCKKHFPENIEIILLPDNNIPLINGVTIIPTGAVSPGCKRNIGVKMSSGNYIAFFDSDSYPCSNWLQHALAYMKDEFISAVCGPNITPPNDSFLQISGGFVLSSIFMGSLRKRYTPYADHIVDDPPSCNILIRRRLFTEISWNEHEWPGEDTLLSNDIIKAKKCIQYSKNVIVYHHRRPLYKQHLTQISSYGRHRGYFIRKYKSNSLKLIYFLPTLALLIYISCFLLSFYYQSFFLFISLSLFYLLSIFLSVVYETQKIEYMVTVTLGIILTHLFYSVSFFRGLMDQKYN